MSNAPPEPSQPPERRTGPEVPPLTRIAGLTLWSVLALAALWTSASYWQAGPTSAIEMRFMLDISAGRMSSSPGGGVFLETAAIWLPLLHALSVLSLAFAWYFLYRCLKFYLLPTLFLDARPPERGVDMRTRLGILCLQRGFLALAVAVVLHVMPGVLGQILPFISRGFSGFGY